MKNGDRWSSWVVPIIRRASAAIEPAYLQPAAQFSFIFLGIEFLAFSIGWTEVAVIVAASYGTELALSYLLRRVIPSPRAALSAAFSICVFFRATHLYYYALVAAVAILSKYVIRVRGKHIFNPSNFAIVAFALLMPAATTIQFIQWDDNAYLYAAITAICLFVSYKTKTITMALSFLASYLVVLLVSISYLPWVFAPHHYGLLSPVLVLFACFMLTDPKTAPQGGAARILYGISIALAYFLLELYGVRYSIFVALFLVLLGNAFSELLMAQIRRHYARLPTIPNLATVSVLLCIACWSYGTEVIGRSVADPHLPSLSFVLFGIQSNELLACSQGKIFNPAPPSGLEEPAQTLGAAWGDYDGDGYEDLFVSNWDKPSRLYRNNGNGTFSDVTQKVGLPLESSASAFFADYDNSGELSLFIVDPEAPKATSTKKYPLWYSSQDGSSQAVRVYKNHKGFFTDATTAVGLNSFMWRQDGGGSMSFADYNNDGLLDFVITQPGKILSVDLGNEAFSRSDIDPDFHNSSETICGADNVRAILAKEPRPTDPWIAKELDALTSPSQKELCLRAFHSPQAHSETEEAVFLGNNGKGRLTHSYNLIVPGTMHLFVQQNGRFIEKPEFDAYTHSLWEKNATGTLLAGAESFDVMMARYFQPVSFDFDGDGKVDVFVTVDFGRNLFLKNMGNLTFKDETVERGLNISGSGMGVAVGDSNGSGLPDIFVTNTVDDYLFVNQGNGSFRNARQEIGRAGVGWGAGFLDYDLSGSEGLFIVNGDIGRTGLFPLTTLGVALFRADALYKNVGGKFLDRTWKDFCSDFQSGKAMAIADYDNDGDPDVFVGNLNTNENGFHVGAMSLGKVGGNGNVLYENDTNSPEKRNKNYIEIKLKGTVSNAMGIGSTVRVTSGGVTQTQFAIAGESFYSEHSQWLLFGLDTHTAPVDIEVSWPSGHKTTLHHVAINQRRTISENE